MAMDDNVFAIENSKRSVILLDSSDESQNEQSIVNTEMQDFRNVTEYSDYDQGFIGQSIDFSKDATHLNILRYHDKGKPR
jgi:arginine/ornithine N-succinyltransferase beta subunit